jgi:hypothetical protein
MTEAKPTYEEFWKEIRKNEGISVHTKTGIEFTYSIRASSIIVDGTNWPLNPKMLRRAYDMWPVEGPGGFCNEIQRSSYVWGIFKAATQK